MQFTLSSTISKFFFTASVVLLAWTAVAQGAAIDAKQARDGIVADVARPSDYLYFMASDIEKRKTGGDRPVDMLYTNGISPPAERGLSGPKTDGDRLYFLSSEIETRETEGGDLARRLNPPVPDDDAAYFRVGSVE